MDYSRNFYSEQPRSSNDYGNNQNYNSFPHPSYMNSGYNSNNPMDGYGGNNYSMPGNGMNSAMGGNNNMRDRSSGMGGSDNSSYNSNINDSNLLSSIQSLSYQMSSQQNEIASKILSALSSSTMMGNMQNQPRNNYDNEVMGGDYERGGRWSRRRSRSPPSFRRRSRELASDRFPSRGGRWETRGRSSFASNRYRYESPRYRSEHSRLDYKRPRPGRSTSKERDSDMKRRKSDKETENKAEGEGVGTRKSEEDSKKESKRKLNDDTPLDALYCHMCKHGNFTSIHTYLCHLEGSRHMKTAQAFHEKNEATLEYLRQNAKLASIRFGGYDRSVNIRCSVCLCVVRESFLKHKKLLEHKLVSRFLKPKCCGRFFYSRYAADEHKLSLPHLKKNYEENKEKHLLLEDTPKGEYTKWTFDEAIKHLKGMNPQVEEELTLDNIPPFDGNTSIGVNFLAERDALLCKPCEQLIPIGVKSLDNHMLSADHYNSVVDFLRRRRREMLFDSKNKDDKERQKERENADETKRGRRRGQSKDSDDDEDDDEDEDEDEDEDDDDAVAEVINLSDDEDNDNNKEHTGNNESKLQMADGGFLDVLDNDSCDDNNSDPPPSTDARDLEMLEENQQGNQDESEPENEAVHRQAMGYQFEGPNGED